MFDSIDKDDIEYASKEIQKIKDAIAARLDKFLADITEEFTKWQEVLAKTEDEKDRAEVWTARSIHACLSEVVGLYESRMIGLVPPERREFVEHVMLQHRERGIAEGMRMAADAWKTPEL